MSKQVTETEQMRLILRIVCIRHELTKLIISDSPLIDANYDVIYKAVFWGTLLYDYTSRTKKGHTKTYVGWSCMSYHLAVECYQQNQ